MIVMKFGGSSLANAERIQQVGEIVAKHLHENPILVLSAINHTTNELIEAGQAALAGKVDATKIVSHHLQILAALNLANSGVEKLLEELTNLLHGISLLRELTRRTLAYLLSFGEILSLRIFYAYLCQRGIEAEPFEGWKAGIVTTSDFDRAEILAQTYQNVAMTFRHLKKGVVPIITGFIAKDMAGNITTLGRGGSDLTAAVIGAALGVREIQLWKDVHGVYSTDPRILDTAVPISVISFQEASELAYFGAKILHPQSILPAMKMDIPVRVKNSYHPEYAGTLIVSNVIRQDGLVTAIAYKPHQTMVHISSTRMLGQYGFLAKVFQIFSELKISVDVITTSAAVISLTLENQVDVEELEKHLRAISTVTIQQNKAIISLIGSTKYSSKILEKALRTLSQEKISVQMISHGASGVNTSLVVDDSQAKRSIFLLHEHFFACEEVVV